MESSSSKSYQNGIRESGAGFTLIELVVVLGLFMLIMGVTVSIFISIIQQQKKILAQQEMLNQVSFVQERVSSSLQSARPDMAGNCLIKDGLAYKGRAYLLTHFDAESGFFQGVKFLSAEGICREIFLDSDGILKEVAGIDLAQQILSSRFKISYARFVINGDKNALVAAPGAMPPRISLAFNIKDPSYENSQEMVVQITASNR